LNVRARDSGNIRRNLEARKMTAKKISINQVDYEQIVKTALNLSMRIDDIKLKQLSNGNTIQKLKSENKSLGQERGELEKQRHTLFMGLK